MVAHSSKRADAFVTGSEAGGSISQSEPVIFSHDHRKDSDSGTVVRK